MFSFAIAASAMTGDVGDEGWDCTVSSNNEENVGRCTERDDGEGNICVPDEWHLIFNNKCSGNIYTIIVAE